MYPKQKVGKYYQSSQIYIYFLIFQTGTWTYSLRNNHTKSQLLTVTMTTRARSPTTLPVITTAHISQNTAHYPSPMIVYARVSQGFLPVLGINVTAIIENEDGHQVTLELWDNGAGNKNLHQLPLNLKSSYRSMT